MQRRKTTVVPSLTTAALASVVAMLAAGMFEYNFGDSEFLMLFLVLVTLPYTADGLVAARLAADGAAQDDMLPATRSVATAPHPVS